MLYDSSALIFLSTLSLRRATLDKVKWRCSIPDFYPRSPCGERHNFKKSVSVTVPFLSTLSLRRATIHSCSRPSRQSNFYPRSPCGERHSDPVTDKAWALISIHALLAESDSVTTSFQGGFAISIHALLAESDTIFAVRPYDAPIFLSTLSLRRATRWARSRRRPSGDFYPRSPCGERPPRHQFRHQ